MNCAYQQCPSRTNNESGTRLAQESQKIQQQKTVFKSCHHCATLYCSKLCRQLDWPDHKSRCVYARLSSMCKRVIIHIGNDPKWRTHASQLALHGSPTPSRGFVWAEFDSYESALELVTTNRSTNFIRKGFLQYISSLETVAALASLLSGSRARHSTVVNDDEHHREEDNNETAADVLTRLVRDYEPQKEFVFVVSVRLEPKSPDLLVFKFIKIPLRLKKPPAPPPSQPPAIQNRPILKSLSRSLSSLAVQQRSPQSTNGNDSSFSQTLILTSLNNNMSSGSGGEKIGREANEEDRQLFLANILNELQLRGVNLRQAYPNIYEDLCLYVEENKPLAPICLFPRDAHTGALFMCLIMPKSDPVSCPWLYQDQ